MRVIKKALKGLKADTSKLTATNCMEPAKINILIKMAHPKWYPLLERRIPKAVPRKRYPAITGIV